METTEIAETIHGGHEAHSAEGDATFRKFAAIYLGIIAMLLAITSLGGSNATKVMLSANIQASDTYGFYQSRNIRQTIYQVTAEELEAQLSRPARHAGSGQGQVRGGDQALSCEGSSAMKAILRLARARRSCSPRPRNGRTNATRCRAGSEFRLCGGAVPDCDCHRVGQHCRRFAFADQTERRPCHRGLAVDDQRLF